MLREKIVALEQHLAESDTRRHETEEEFAKNRKLVKLLEKYKCELNEANTEIERLKSKVSNCNELQVSNSLMSALCTLLVHFAHWCGCLNRLQTCYKL